MSYINGYPKKNNEKKDTHLSKHTETKKKHAVKNGVSTPQSTRRGRSVYAAFAQRGGGNAGWAAEKKDEVNVGQMHICIISKFFVWMGQLFFEWEISEHLDFTFGTFAISFLGEHGRTGFHVRFRSFFLALGFCGRKTSSTKNIPLKIPVGTTCDGTQR